MTLIHHLAICVVDLEESLRFWRDGIGMDVLMDQRFRGDWPHLFGAPTDSLRAVFLGDPSDPNAGIVELVDLGSTGPVRAPSQKPAPGMLLLSVMTDLDATLARLDSLGLGGDPRRVEVGGVAMAVVADPDGVLVELIDTGALETLDRLRSGDTR